MTRRRADAPAPKEALLGPKTTLVLLHTIYQPWPTTGTLSRSTGLSRGGVSHHLRKLRALGLVSWEMHKEGTLRPCVKLCDQNWGEPVGPS